MAKVQKFRVYDRRMKREFVLYGQSGESVLKRVAPRPCDREGYEVELEDEVNGERRDGDVPPLAMVR